MSVAAHRPKCDPKKSLHTESFSGSSPSSRNAWTNVDSTATMVNTALATCIQHAQPNHQTPVIDSGSGKDSWSCLQCWFRRETDQKKSTRETRKIHTQLAATHPRLLVPQTVSHLWDSINDTHTRCDAKECGKHRSKSRGKQHGGDDPSVQRNNLQSHRRQGG